ncbi:uncharacterized protein FOMMEDRAFT_171505 [Fomitiporia mediterranea MF3/22]|uniref:G protein-coupled receptor n=1 Tax=Fomitiporia mediterranea (strain MF3/22) TaxID=694068 RepID=R7SG88_FOMME|nr:uncharacterized protein FOMMEDRAFT_171505 [Fomitiporia mediterranea MF3/22]EJC97723.1 hypothetical protein FOMMEDRAFT_171505 [Fomitiporia mediterranea MF3/22]
MIYIVRAQLTDILLMRVVALYSQNRTLDRWLKFILFSQAAASLGVLLYYTYLEKVTSRTLTEGITICALSIRPPFELVIAWLLPMANGLLLLYLSVRKAAYIRRRTTFKGLRLVKVIIQDQVIYYCFYIAVAVFKIAYITTNNPQAAIILFSIGNPVLLCILGDQLLFNLKEAGRGVVVVESSYMTSEGYSEDVELTQFSSYRDHRVA